MALRTDLDTALSRTMGEAVEEAPESAQERAELYQVASSLQIAQMLVDLNEVVLRGAGRLESTSLMDYYDDEDMLFELVDDEDDDPEDEDDEADEDSDEGEELRFSLFWDDVTECAVDVELGKTGEGRLFVMVNGEEVRQQREVLETAVLEAFRDEMDL